MLGAVLGWAQRGSVAGAASVFSIVAVLAVLEISLSFDNAVVNAHRLKTMTPAWQRRFLTWGILIAVFGMRIVFPLAIVAVAAKIGPVAALRLAVTEPGEYARIMEEAHLGIAAFGGTFLMMVSLAYFFDRDKKIHWVSVIERRFRSAAQVRGVEIGFVLLTMLLFAALQDDANSPLFMSAAVWGLVTFLMVDVTRHLLDRADRRWTPPPAAGSAPFSTSRCSTPASPSTG